MKRIASLLLVFCLVITAWGVAVATENDLMISVFLYFHNYVTRDDGSDICCASFVVECNKGDELIFTTSWDDGILDWKAKLEGGRIFSSLSSDNRVGLKYYNMENCVWRYKVTGAEEGKTLRLFSETEPTKAEFKVPIVSVFEGKIVERSTGYYGMYGEYEYDLSNENYTCEPVKIKFTKDGALPESVWIDVVLTDKGKEAYDAFVMYLYEDLMVPISFFEGKEEKVIQLMIGELHEDGTWHQDWRTIDLNEYTTDVKIWAEENGTVHIEEVEDNEVVE